MYNFTRFIAEPKLFFRKILNPGFESVSWQIIYRVEIMGIGMASIYLIYDFFFNEGTKNSIIGIAVLPLYLFFLFLILKHPDNRIVQNVVVISNFLSMNLSFVFLAGPHYISAPTVIDFSLSLLVVTIVYRNWERIAWSMLHLIVLVLFITLSILSYTDREPHNYILQAHSDFVFGHIEIFSRLIFIFILGLTFLKDYDRQRQLVFHKNEEVHHLNQNLEELVKRRTERLKDLNNKLREYSFLNSHKVRAPLARMMGIMNLINSEKIILEDERLQKYLGLLEASSEELDKVVQEMNNHLSEQEEE